MIKKMRPKFIKKFEEYGLKMNESDGFGSSDFLMEKVSDVYHYFFNIENEDGDGETGYHLIIGKYSSHEVIEGAKNSYCVLTINRIPHELIDDIAIDKEDIPLPNDDMFRARGSEVSRITEYICRCLQNYLELNPKISRIYDEIQYNLVFRGRGTYMEHMKSIVTTYLGEWSVQEGSSKKSILISR